MSKKQGMSLKPHIVINIFRDRKNDNCTHEQNKILLKSSLYRIRTSYRKLKYDNQILNFNKNLKMQNQENFPESRTQKIKYKCRTEIKHNNI